MDNKIITAKDYLFQNTFKPLMTLISNCGVYYMYPKRDKVCGRCLSVVSLIITAFTFVLGWFQTGRVGWLTDWKNLTSPTEASKAMFFILNFYNAIIQTVVNISWRQNIRVYFEKLERSKIRLTRRANITLRLMIGLWIMVLFLLAVYVPYNVISDIRSGKGDGRLAVYLRTAPFVPGTVIWDVGLVLYCLYMSLVYIRLGVILNFFMLSAYHIGMEFKSVQQRLKMKHYNIQCLEMIREEYEEAVSLVDTIESMFSSTTFFTYVCCLPLLCFTIYSFQKWELSPDAVVVVFNALVGSIVPPVVITLSGAYINSMSTCFEVLLHRVRVSGVDEQTSRCLQMFTSRVVTSRVGITAMGLLLVERATILTLAGTVVTYVVFVLQFSPYPTGPICPHGNITCTC